MSKIRIPRQKILATLDEHGWTKGSFEQDDGRVCLHGAIRLCDPRDANLIEQVWQRRGYGTYWNDRPSTTEAMVRQYVLEADPITDRELGETFGPQWKEIVALVRRASALTEEEASRLNAAWNDARDAAGYSAWNAARDAARYDARYAVWYDARYAARGATRDVAAALVVRDLIGQYGFTQEHYDLLIEPWRTVVGKVHPDDLEVQSE